MQAVAPGQTALDSAPNDTDTASDCACPIFRNVLRKLYDYASIQQPIRSIRYERAAPSV